MPMTNSPNRHPWHPPPSPRDLDLDIHPVAMTRRKSNLKRVNGAPYQNGSPITSQPPESTSTLQPSSSSASPTSKATSILSIWAPTLLLIFGGCCSNVYTLESLIKASPTSGALITASQFLLVALTTLPRHFSPSRGWRNAYLRPRSIPLRKWAIYTAYFLSINILNNMAFKYSISIPLHIILRSAGPVTTMAVGRLYGGKRYPPRKVVAVILLSVGVVLAAFSDAASKEEAHHSSELESSAQNSSSGIMSSSQAPGFALLASALLLSACMGLYTDNMYATHGRSSSITAETLFYSHAMSLPYFAGQAKPLMREFAHVKAAAISDFEAYEHWQPGASGEQNATSSSFSSWAPLANLLPLVFAFAPGMPGMPLRFSPSDLLAYTSLIFHIPRPVILLLLNAATQLLCIVGVNRLSAQSSSLTVSIVLNMRKLASLVLSIWLFGNDLPSGVLTGAAIVFLGGGLYALPARPARPSVERESRKKQQHDEKKKV
ncbi:golgi uridine diphosphate-N-acetylglucosamine transporter [Exophiala xenobiotica]|uniref:Golgi uridine diphosphate-N-acetylglucosamine transporter n=1 Tax=Vermiconidia calcicola TaxID=1690605 RepID=A0AAV9QJV9_9PEZI|nr:golgi uridine diphosphate-N-acetylglucosamine transporter [Exophiala xenobiotica]KAK5543729.1 golgi uridine diphosphate-N-acetylglucosamine transporter [Vermiconidia calcicola]KAK5548406.1 golgi uridine diphosphate-N-acetylglucosamine transporter [Chaetothyriales sp. CCFEE 6169]KAK5250967.1 golgi uridine diphosphate-N-acetylglucosamine transporter [Exophiala xenobiotica]KAK5307472.1 golgi uridine diphosphate-N-acetylglucosamine transporter [Exophiala xenobiotica]